MMDGDLPVTAVDVTTRVLILGSGGGTDITDGGANNSVSSQSQAPDDKQ